MGDLEEKVEQLDKKKQLLSDKVMNLHFSYLVQKQELDNKLKAMEKRFQEKRNICESKRTAEKEFLTYQNQHLDTFLSRLEDQEN